MPWPRWPLLLAGLLTAGPSLAAGEKLTPLSQTALVQLRARELSRIADSQTNLKAQTLKLGLSSMDDFRLSGANTDRFGQTHARFAQLYQGVPVWGAMAITHMSASGLNQPVTADGLRKGIRLGVNPTVDMADAISLATLELAPRGLLSARPTAELIVYPQTQLTNRFPEKPYAKRNAEDFTEEVVGYKLAWHVHTELDNRVDGIKHTDFILDAQSGDLLKKWNSLKTAAAIGTGHSQYSGDVKLDVWKLKDGTFELRDTTRALGEGIRTYDVAHAEVQDGEIPELVIYTDPDNVWGDGQNYEDGGDTQNDNGQTAAVDAHYGLLTTWDFYKKVLGRNGIDDLGSPTYNRVHASYLYDNAFWSDGCFCMSYGDGSYPDPGGFKSMAALDVTGHELSHGVMSQTADLIYSGESGGLNEANSDIFGTMVEFWTHGGRGATIGNTGGNFRIGEDLSDPPLRVMYKPSLDGKSPDAWYPGIGNVDVHFSSGPMNRAFYFLAQGAKSTDTANDYSSTYLPGGMTGIGNDKAAAIWYRAITTYLYPSANYMAARTASLQSAADLFGALSSEYRAVQNAFAAINVGYTAGTYDDRTPPTVSTNISGSAPTLHLNAVATDNVGIKRVEFFVDGALAGTSRALPFTVPLDTTLLTNGPHLLTAVAYDAAGNRGMSEPTTFTVTNSFEQILRDPGFELAGEGWEADPRGNINYPSSGARTGLGYVWLNGYGAFHIDNLYQDVTIPASATKAALTFYLNLTTEETGTTANDTFVVQVRDTSGAVVETLATWSNLNPTLGWVQRSFDLSAYAGQTIRIYLEGNENNSKATNFKLDDFALRVTDSADTEAPIVKATVLNTGTQVGLFADVSDNGYVGAVEFLLDGTSVGTAATSFAQAVTLSTLSNGSHTLVAKAVDAAGNEGSSAPVTFFVDLTRKQIVLNPSFEDTSTAGRAAWPITTTRAGSAGVLNSADLAHSGNRSFAFLYTGLPSKSATRQTITVPADATSAIYSFWLLIYTGAFTDGVAHHTITAKVRDSSGTDLKTLETFSNLDDTGAKYFEHRYDLSAYKGQDIQIYFEADLLTPGQVSGGVTYFFIDDVTLNTSGVADTLPPAVSLSAIGSYGSIGLSATVSDNIWTSSLEFFVDDESVGDFTDANGGPYTAYFNSTSLTNGVHHGKVKATDSSGNVTTATVDFEVRNSTVTDVGAPNVTASVDGVFEVRVLKADATDDTGVTAVEFYVDGAFQGRATAPPYSVPFNPMPLSVGMHTLEAVAFDAYGHSNKAATTFTREAVLVTIEAPSVVLPVGGSATFTASATNVVDTSVRWSVREGRICGTVSATGTYSAHQVPGICHVVATSTADVSASAAATVKVFTGDLNGDHVVDGEDMGLMAQAFGSSESGSSYSEEADLDGTGAVDDNDVTLFVSQFGR
ncbi:M4 family metallopeptidase [Vitiosangium sp. GDMCC 1.1324]|uniref:M4 family metallopeptidase n=1 Tax=Vitiosangium sp. (strain GDMCC 1.1324) TaxID=2138576 RepID=UPI00130DE935|nr:M4 family metallopeptidase [Vitiosangium sp. GDMCC 1.1324]